MEAAMSIDERVREVIVRESDRPDYQHLREFYEEKKREGAVVKQEYTLPPIDTVGRSLYAAILEEAEEE
jgi:hypothetical protein